VVLGCESSLGDPNLGGPIVTEGSNFGSIKWRRRTESNAAYHDLSSGAMERRGSLWFTFPTPDVGTRAWGLFIASEGYTAALNAEDWPGFAARYYGEKVPGFKTYLQDMQAMAARFKARAAAYGWSL